MKSGDVQQTAELVDGSLEKPGRVDLLGAFKHTVKLTGLDCSACASARNGNGSKCLSLISRLLAIIVICLVIFRAFAFLGQEGKILSLNWSESNVFGFMGLHSVVCCFCLMGWTANGFVPNYLRQLEEVRGLRVEQNESLDDYSGLRRKAVIFSLPWFAVLISTALFNAFNGKIVYSGVEETAYKYAVFPALTSLVWLITSTCVTYYNLVQFSMTREIEYFNKELQKASEEKKLKDLPTVSDFSYRQKALFKLVSKTNESLQSYAKVAPLFCFFSVINAIYNMSYFSDLPIFYAVSLLFLLINVIGMIIFTLLPACKVQDQLTATARILMDTDEFENAEEKVYQTYRIMVDRSLKNDTRIYVVNGFAIDSTSFNIAMFVVPNLGPIVMMLRKVLEANGVKVS